MKKEKYVVGYAHEAEVYGLDDGERVRWAITMTLKEAQEEVEKFERGAVIYKLVKVDPKKI